MNVNSSLENAFVGLQSAQQGLLLTSQNVTNANRTGYARRSVPTGNDMTSGGSTGANNGTQLMTIRSTDSLLLGQIFTLTGRDQYAQTLVQTTATLNTMLGQADLSIAQALGNFLNAAGSLANDVSSPVLQGSLVASGQQLVDRFANFQSMVGNIQRQAQQGLSDNLNQANTDLSQLAQINQAIMQGSTRGNTTSVPDLLDQRDALILDLQKRVGGDATILSDGTADYRITGVQMVQGGSANQFAQSSGSTSISNEVALSDIFVQVPGGTTSTKALIRTQSSDASDQTVNILRSGAAGAYVELLQEFVPAMQARLNLTGASIAMQTNAAKRADGTLIAPVFGYLNGAGQYTTSANEISQMAGYSDVSGSGVATFRQVLDALDPSSPTYSRSAVSKLNQTGIQISQMRLVLSGAVASVGTIDSQAARSIESSRSTLGEPLTAINSQWAQKLSQWGKDQSLQSTLLKSVNDQYQSVAGVNLDEEAINMQTFQRQYTAASKLMQTINRMLDDLLSMMSSG